MADIGTLNAKFVLDTSELRSQASEGAKSVEGEFTKAAGNVAKAFAGLAVAKGAFDFVKEGVARLGEMEITTARTNAVLKSTGGIANVTAGSIESYAKKVQNTIGVQGDLVQSGENVLLKYTGIRNELGKGNDIFDQTRKAMVDLSVATGKDMASSAATLGKALQDPEKGMLALKRAGVNLTESQKEAITSFVAMGDTLSAQKIILDAVNDTVGGSAKAYGETLPAKMAVAQQKFADMRAEIASAFLPAIEFGAQAVGFLSDTISSLPGPLNAAVIGAVGLGAAVGTVAGPVNEMIDLGGSFADVGSKIGDAWKAGAGNVVIGVASVVGAAAVMVGVGLGIAKLAGAFDITGVSASQFGQNLAKIPTADAVTKFNTMKTAIDSIHGPLGIAVSDELRHNASLEVFKGLAGESVPKAIALRDAWVAQGIAGRDNVPTIGQMNDVIDQNSEKVAKNREYVAASADELVTWAAGLQNASGVVKDIKARTEEFNLTLAAGLGPALDATSATLNYQQSIDALTEALLLDTTGMNFNEAAGRNVAAALENLTGASMTDAQAQIALAISHGDTARAADISKLAAVGLSGSILESGAAAGRSGDEMVMYTAKVLNIPPSMLTTILQNAPDAQAAIEQMIAYVLSVNGTSATVSITTRQYYETIYSTSGWAGVGPRPPGMAHGGIAGAANGLVTRGPAIRVIGEAGPEAVVPLGPSNTNARDRDRVMKQAGLFQIQPMADGGMTGDSQVGTWSGGESVLRQMLAVLVRMEQNQTSGGGRSAPNRTAVAGRR